MSHYLTDFLQDSKRDKSRLILPAVGFRLRAAAVILSDALAESNCKAAPKAESRRLFAQNDGKKYSNINHLLWHSLFNLIKKVVFSIILCLDTYSFTYPHFSSFFWERKRKNAPKRRKKNRGQAPACREYGNILRKQDIQMIPGDDSKRHTVSSKASLKTRSHNAARGFSYKNTAELLPQRNG